MVNLPFIIVNCKRKLQAKRRDLGAYGSVACGAIRPEPAMGVAVINSDWARVRTIMRLMNEDRIRMATAVLRPVLV